METIIVKDDGTELEFHTDGVMVEFPIDGNMHFFTNAEALTLARAIMEHCGGADVIREAVLSERLRLQDFFTWLSLDHTHHSDYLWKHDKSGEFHSHQELYREYLIKKGIEP